MIKILGNIYPRNICRIQINTGSHSRLPFLSHARLNSSDAKVTQTSKLDPKQTPPPKPKSSTPLRKTASASLPIREKRTPTRGVIQPVFTLSTAERYSLPRILPSLKRSNAQILAESLWVPTLQTQNGNGEAFVFENGCVVFWGVEESNAKRFVRDFVRRGGAEVGRYSEEETEELEFVTDSSECVQFYSHLTLIDLFT